MHQHTEGTGAHCAPEWLPEMQPPGEAMPSDLWPLVLVDSAVACAQRIRLHQIRSLSLGSVTLSASLKTTTKLKTPSNRAQSCKSYLQGTGRLNLEDNHTRIPTVRCIPRLRSAGIPGISLMSLNSNSYTLRPLTKPETSQPKILNPDPDKP